QSFIEIGRLKRSMNPCDMRMLARLTREGSAGRVLDAMALSPEWPAATAAVAAEVFKNMRRSRTWDSLRDSSPVGLDFKERERSPDATGSPRKALDENAFGQTRRTL